MDTNEENFLSIIAKYFTEKSPEDIEVVLEKDKYGNGSLIVDPSWISNPSVTDEYSTIPPVSIEDFNKYLVGALAYFYRSENPKEDYLCRIAHQTIIAEAKIVRRELIQEELINAEREGRDSVFISTERAMQEIDQDKVKEYVASRIGKLKFKMFRPDGELGNPSFTIMGIDGKTKLQVFSSVDENSRGHQISIQKLYDLIIQGQEYLKNMSFTDSATRGEIKMSSEMIQRRAGIKLTLDSLAKAFTEYFDYLIEAKKDHEKPDEPEDVEMEQETSERGPNLGSPGNSVENLKERKNAIIPYEETDPIARQGIEDYETSYRRPILESSGLRLVRRFNHRSNLNGENERIDGYRPAYDCYMSKVDQDGGVLMFLEPVDGTHLTRVIYCKTEKLGQIFRQKSEALESEGKQPIDSEVKNGRLSNEQIGVVSEYYFKMSERDFSKGKHGIPIQHTSVDAFNVLVYGLCTRNPIIDFEKLKVSDSYRKSNAEMLTRRKLEILGMTEWGSIAREANPELLNEAEAVLANRNQNIDRSSPNGHNL